MMYLVRRYVDCMGNCGFGVDNSNYIVGLFDSEDKANAAMEKAIAQAKETDYEDQYDCHLTTIDIIPISVNKTYEEGDQLYLGGGFYIE